jgi:DNA-binding LacI/PurR family transcriptional regulator
VRQPLSDIGEQAVRLILQRIRGQAPAQEADDAPIELPSTLVIRDSCGPAPEAALG